MKFSGGDAKEGEKHGEATDDDHYVGGMDEIVGVQEATRLVRLGVSYEPYADAEDGSAEHKEKNLEEDEQNANDLIHGVEIGDAQTSTTVPDIHMFQFAGRPSGGGRSGGADRSGHAVRACHRLDLRLGGVSRLSGGYATAVLQQVELILGQ